MKQEDFSNYVYQYILENHPLFLDNLQFKPDKSLDCSLMSPTGKFSVWIATFDSEITIGMDDPEHKSGAHTHMSFYGNEADDQARAMTEYLHDIFNDKLIFIYSNLSGYSWTRDLVETLMDKGEDEAIDFFSWTGEV